MALTETQRPSDAVRWEANQDYTREVATVDTDETIAVGQAVVITAGAAAVVADGAEATTNGIALQAGVATDKIVCLVRGPAIVNKDKIVLDTDADLDDTVTALLALEPPIVCLAEATVQQIGVPTGA